MVSPVATPSNTPAPRGLAAVFVHLCFGAAATVIFVGDIWTPADNVSVCFAYAPAILIGLFAPPRTAYAYALATTVLSGLGSLAQPPEGAITAAYLTNRAIAVLVQWGVAMLIDYQIRMEGSLRRSLDAERQKAEQQRRFIAIMSHELKTPLTIIDGQAYRLIKLATELDPESTAMRARKIRGAAARLVEILDLVLFSSEVGAGDIAMERATVPLRDLVGEVAAECGDLDGAQGFELDLTGLPGRIEGDPKLVRHALSNIIDNALKYSPNGGLIRIFGHMDDGKAVITVTDRGVGIAMEELPNVSGLYYRGGNSTGIPGAGIGLYLVERFVAMHGGTLSLASRIGEGTTVTIRLPVGQGTEDKHA